MNITIVTKKLWRKEAVEKKINKTGEIAQKEGSGRP